VHRFDLHLHASPPSRKLAFECSITRVFLIAAIVLVFGMALLEKTGEYLVMDQPAHADVIVVLAGETEMIAASFAVLSFCTRDTRPVCWWTQILT
jgi:hypothetical protein